MTSRKDSLFVIIENDMVEFSIASWSCFSVNDKENKSSNAIVTLPKIELIEPLDLYINDWIDRQSQNWSEKNWDNPTKRFLKN